MTQLRVCIAEFLARYVDLEVEHAYARTLVNKLRRPNGQIPRYYLVVLKVKFKAGVPTETTYILHREVHMTEQLGVPDNDKAPG